MEYNELTYACAISSIFGSRCLEARRVAEHFLNPGELFSLSTRELQELFGTRGKIIEKISGREILDKSAAEVEWCAANNISISYFKDNRFPKRLNESPDAPIILFHKGAIDFNTSRFVSIVGTRKPTSYGLSMCKEIVSELAKLNPQVVIVSGLAYGIDICAHKSALEHHIPTIGVMATPIDTIYPSLHRQYACNFLENGGILTEFHKGEATLPVNFLRRNRIIAGLSDATVLIESKIQGGGMVTASIANSYSREVFALPGKITDPQSQGCNFIIGENMGRIITSAKDIAIGMGWYQDRGKKGKKVKFQELLGQYDTIKQNILLTLSADLTINTATLVEKSQFEPRRVLSALTELEMDQIIEKDIYGNYHICI